MKLRLLPALLVLLPFLSMAQLITLKGRVIDSQTGYALQGAHLKMNNRLVKVTTDKNGQFEMPGLKAGTYKLNVSYIGYHTWESLIDVTENKDVVVPMESAPVLSPETIITATRANEKTPVTYQNLSENEIKNLDQGRDVPFLMEQMTSTVVSSDAGTGVGYTAFRIRGTDMNRINITVNGIPLNDAESHDVYWVDLPDFASSVSSMQVQRGVGTSTNGASAFGASINLQTTTPPADAYGTVTSAGGSFNTWRNTVETGTGLISGKWALDARLSKISSDGYIDRATSDLKSFFVSGGFYGKNTIVKLNVLSGKEITYLAWDGVPSAYLDSARTWNGLGMYTDNSGTIQFYKNEVDNYQQDHYQVLISQKLPWNMNANLALHYTHGFGYYEQYKQDQNLEDYRITPVLFPGYDSLYISKSDLVSRKYLDNDFYGFTWSLNYNQKKLSLNLGGSGSRYDGNHYGEVIWAAFAQTAGVDHRWYSGTGDKRDLNVYTKAQYQATRQLNLYADVQLRSINYTIDGTDDDLRAIGQKHNFLFFNPKGGIYVDLFKAGSLYLSMAVAHREPNRSNYTDADPSRPGPVAETLFDYELGYHYSNNSLKASANLYYMYYRNQLVLTGQINDVGSAIMTNVPVSYRKGIELTGSTALGKKMMLNASLTLSSNKIRNFTEFVDDWDNWGSQLENHLGNTRLAFSPEVIGGAEFGWNFYQGFTASLNGKYVSRQYIDNTASSSRSLNPYFVSNAKIAYEMKPAFLRGLEFILNINNLFNAAYETNAWVYRYYSDGEYGTYDGYFPQAGINFMFGVILKI